MDRQINVNEKADNTPETYLTGRSSLYNATFIYEIAQTIAEY